MRLPKPRGPLGERVTARLRGDASRAWDDVPAPSGPAGVVDDDDFQLALWVLYELYYRGFEDVAVDLEWAPDVIALRQLLEARFERELRDRTAVHVEGVAVEDDLYETFQHLIGALEGPNLAGFIQREATAPQVRDLLARRSLYHLKESDPHSFVLPRIDGPAKTALAELQYDEYGAGRPERLHARLYADALSACGLDDAYGAYVDSTPATTLAVNNAMSLFGLQRRLRGAALGHLAAFESTSSLPCRRIAAGIERVGLPARAAAYFHEHVEADAVHEQVAVRSICAALVAGEPALLSDVLFGAATCLLLDALDAEHVLATWTGAPSQGWAPRSDAPGSAAGPVRADRAGTGRSGLQLVSSRPGGGSVRHLQFGPLDISYDDRVLEPRPWTAGQSEWAADLLRDAPAGPVLELCSGAGHIGLLAVTLCPRELVMVDADAVACDFARANIEANSPPCPVQVRQGRIDEALEDGERFAGIIADPPWVLSADLGRFPEDPGSAIDGGPDGMAVARACIDAIARHLDDHGWALLQLGTQAQVDLTRSHLQDEPQLGLRVIESRAYDGRGVVVHLARRP